MSMLEELKQLGADVKEGLERLGGKEDFYVRMLKKLPATVENNPVMPLIEAGNIAEATANAHALKGVFGNLSVTPLYGVYTEIVNVLRAGNPDRAKELLAGVLPLQEQILNCIAANQ